jgi:amidophosphoribosyltransferase
VAAVQHEKAAVEGFDTSCFSGEYVTGDVSRAYLDALEVIRSNSAKARRDAKVRAEESDDDTMQVASGL